MSAPEHLRRRRWRLVVLGLAAWAIVAYLVAPTLWTLYFERRPYDALLERITQTSDGHPGDPVNVALVGTRAELVRAMAAAGWHPADPITLKSSLEIAADSVLRRPDDEAPVSPLFLFGRRQDLAFEQPVGGNPRQRHHVRFWEWSRQLDGRPVWFGAATYDERVGLSYTTGQVTHHIAPDVDVERDRIARELAGAGCTPGVAWVDAFHRELSGRNGGGDPWRTDGRLAEISLQPCAPRPRG